MPNSSIDRIIFAFYQAVTPFFASKWEKTGVMFKLLAGVLRAKNTSNVFKKGLNVASYFVLPTVKISILLSQYLGHDAPGP